MCNRRTSLLPSIWSQMFLHWCIMQKNFMDLWAVPFPNSNGYWCCTYDHKRSGRNVLQTSVIITVSGQNYTKGSYKEGKSGVLLPLTSKAASSVRWIVSHFNDACSHLLTDSSKLHITIQNTKTGFTLCHCPVHNTNGKLYNSYIKQQ